MSSTSRWRDSGHLERAVATAGGQEAARHRIPHRTAAGNAGLRPVRDGLHRAAMEGDGDKLHGAWPQLTTGRYPPARPTRPPSKMQ